MESAGFLERVSQAEGPGMQCPPGLHGDSCETGAAELREQWAEVRVWPLGPFKDLISTLGHRTQNVFRLRH